MGKEIEVLSTNKKEYAGNVMTVEEMARKTGISKRVITSWVKIGAVRGTADKVEVSDCLRLALIYSAYKKGDLIALTKWNELRGSKYNKTALFDMVKSYLDSNVSVPAYRLWLGKREIICVIPGLFTEWFNNREGMYEYYYRLYSDREIADRKIREEIESGPQKEWDPFKIIDDERFEKNMRNMNLFKLSKLRKFVDFSLEEEDNG